VKAYWAATSPEEKQRRIGLLTAATRRRYRLPDGTIFGRWTVERYHGPDGYTCRCACGTVRVIRRHSLVSEESTSCGCYSLDLRRARGREEARFYNICALFQSTKIRARHYKHEWKLSLRRYQVLIFQPCHYCGVSGTNFKKSARVDAAGSFYYNGLDRVDFKQGYVPANVVPCCKVCNRAKSDMTLGDFQAWLDQLVAHSRRIAR
jgi:hypothetical protein